MDPYVCNGNNRIGINHKDTTLTDKCSKKQTQHKTTKAQTNPFSKSNTKVDFDKKVYINIV
jgi:hypothetical protein